MQEKALTRKIGISLLLALSLLCSLPAYAADDFNQQLDGLTKKLASAAQGDVLKGTETQVYISLGQTQGILPGYKFEIVRQAEPLKIGDEIMGYEEVRIAEVEVERAREKFSICKVLEQSSIPQSGDKAYQLRKKINTLVVGQFSYNQGFNRLTKNLQEKLVTSMTNRGMQVVERDQLERVLKEQKMGYSGLVNLDTAKKIGELLGAQGMLLGTVSDMGNAITINARMVDIETGKAVSAAAVDLAKTPLITQLLDVPIESANDPYVGESNPPHGGVNKSLKKQQVKEAEDFTFALKGCQKAGSTVTCQFLATNNGADRDLDLINHYRGHVSRMFDNLGNGYDTKSIRLANCQGEGDYCRIRLISGVPTKGAVSFKGVVDDAESAAALELHCHSFTVQFKEIKFTK